MVLQVQAAAPGQVSTLQRVELPSGAATSIGELDYQVNAVGYASADGRLYGIAVRDKAGPFPDGGHVVAPRRPGTGPGLTVQSS